MAIASTEHGRAVTEWLITHDTILKTKNEAILILINKSRIKYEVHCSTRWRVAYEVHCSTRWRVAKNQHVSCMYL
jgi:hypothetical protein